jgi:hypothetical protein
VPLFFGRLYKKSDGGAHPGSALSCDLRVAAWQRRGRGHSRIMVLPLPTPPYAQRVRTVREEEELVKPSGESIQFSLENN